MTKIETNFLENNLFIFNSYTCNSVEDIQHGNPGELETKTIKAHQDASNPIKFAFANDGKGLVRISDNGKIKEENLLGKLISIPLGDSLSLREFFKRNVFFFDISFDEYEGIDTGKLFEVLTRIRATVELLNQVGELNPERKNYDRILSLVMYLLSADTISINSSTGFSFSTCEHAFFEELTQTDLSQDKDYNAEIFTKGTFSVADSIYGSYEFDDVEYKNIMNGYSTVKGRDDLYFKKLIHFYVNNTSTLENHRKLVDFLFHYQMNVGVIKNFRKYNSLEYFSVPKKEQFTSKLKTALIEVAKIVIGEEINSNIIGVYPEYDISLMSPKWRVDSLMSAIYFSLFYLNPNQELYRQCANSNCQNYFVVKTTATNKKYCSDECRNRTQQANHRRKKKSQQ